VKKIPTLFVRDENDRRYVTDQVTQGCEWVLAGQGVATRKYDGTCTLYDGQDWWARREVKPGKQAPAGFVEADYDEVTGKTVGWEPIGQSSFAKFHAEAVEPLVEFGAIIGQPIAPATYELIGPKINGNPEGCAVHRLERHQTAEQFGDVPLTFDGLREFSAGLSNEGIEGIVWHHPDGRMAKLKVRDFPAAAAKETS
jgi:hypothetical protein